ncbi:TonB-dependent receptor plug domain-containing protein [Sulfuricurvum sp.]|uniref:TonB-dependent receptor plug domain-containing protein n=1 Tax=Sulfuricurvum sp. TaxID=2025608 RepID=UPI00356A14E5
MFKPTLVVALCATLVASLGAEELTLAPIAVTSNLYEHNELDAPYSAEVYTAKDIEKSRTTNIYDFFNQQTSLITAPSYGNPFSQKLDVHGYGIGDGYQNIVVTLNGQRLNNIDMVPQLLSAIPLSSIERIEILKGSGAVAYGDGANAAVINIITKEENYNELGVYAGNYHTLGESMYLSSAKERYSYALHLDHSDTDGTRVIDNYGNHDTRKNTNGGVELTYRPTDTLQLHGGAQFSTYDTLYGGPLTLAQYHDDPTQKGSSSATHQTYRSNVINGGLIYTINSNYSVELDSSHENKHSDYITYNFISNYRNDNVRSQINYNNDVFKAKLGVTGTWGERQGSTNTISKDNKALYLSTELHVNNHTFTAGGRYEKVAYTYQDATNTLAQDNALYAIELGYSFIFTPKQSVFAHYAHAFQAPDIDRFFNYDGTFNGFIQPMKTDTYTIGYNNISSANKFKASLYYVNLSNEIYYYSDPFFINSANTNIDKSHKYGIDLSDQLKINDQWNLYANYNYVQAFIDQEQFNGENYAGKKLPGVSDHNVKATVSYLPNVNTTVSLTQLYRSQAYALNDFNNYFAQREQPFRSTNLSVTYTKGNYEMFAKINNLFDKSNGIWIKDNTIYPVDFTTTFTAGLKYIF